MKRVKGLIFILSCGIFLLILDVTTSKISELYGKGYLESFIQEIKIGSHFQCAHRCILNKNRCKSYSVNSGLNICRLHEKSVYGDGVVLTNDNDWDHYEDNEMKQQETGVSNIIPEKVSRTDAASGEKDIRFLDQNIFDVISVWGSTWFVEFKVKVLSFSTSHDFTGILHFAKTGETNGERVPALFIKDSEGKFYFTVSQTTGDIFHKIPDHNGAAMLELGRWYSLRVEMTTGTADVHGNMAYVYSSYVDGVLSSSTGGITSQIFSDVVLKYGSHGSEPPSDAFVKAINYGST